MLIKSLAVAAPPLQASIGSLMWFEVIYLSADKKHLGTKVLKIRLQKIKQYYCVLH